mgnify:CR=1 FL=1
MKIKIEYAGIKFAIDITEDSYNLIRYGTNSDKESANYGKETERVLGYFTNVSNAVLQVIKSSLSSINEEVSLKQYVERIEKAKKEIMEQIDGKY